MAKKSNKKEKKVSKSNIEEEKIKETVPEKTEKAVEKKVSKASNKKVSKDKESKKDTNKNKKSGFKDFKAELKKVVWPTPKELANSTIAVISIVIVTAIIVLILDIAFELFNTYGIEKLRSAYSASQTVEDDATTDEATEEIVEDSDETSEEGTDESADTSDDTTVDEESE